MPENPAAGGPVDDRCDVIIGFDAASPTEAPAVAVRRANGTIHIAPVGGSAPNPGDAIDCRLHTSPPPAGRWRDLGIVSTDGLRYTRSATAGENPWNDNDYVEPATLTGFHQGGIVTATTGRVAPDALAVYLGGGPGVYAPEEVARRRSDRAGQREHEQQVGRTGDVLDQVDAAVAGDCACGCGIPIDDDSPSAYFANQGCQWRWSQQLAADPGDVYRRRDHSMYTDPDGSENYRGTPRPSPVAEPPRTGHAVDDAIRRICEDEPAPSGRRSSPDRVMPAAVLDVARRRLAALFPYADPHYLTRVLHCTRTQCPDLIGAGYRRHCWVCVANGHSAGAVPVDYEITTMADDVNPVPLTVLRISVCGRCRNVLPGPAYRASLAITGLPTGGEVLRFLLEDDDAVIRHMLTLHELYALGSNASAIVADTWATLERGLARARARATPPPDAVVAAVLAHHAYHQAFPVLGHRATARLPRITD